MASDFQTVASVEDLPAGGRARVKWRGRDIALFDVDGRLYALEDRCPHRGGLLSEGELQGGHVYCPLHAWSFELATGRSPTYAPACVETFDVRVVEGEIQLAPTRSPLRGD